MTAISLLQVFAPECHLRCVFRTMKYKPKTLIYVRIAHFWNNQNIKIVQYINLTSITLKCCDINTV
jgi:hypothetical protein